MAGDQYQRSAAVGAEMAARAARVKDRLPLSSLIGRRVRLVKSGREFDGLCPFHSDRNMGSFKVNDDKAMYKCFACNAGGDHFAFLSATLGLDFKTALAELESEAGLAALDFSKAEVRADWDADKARREAEAEADLVRVRRRAVAMWHGAELIKQGTPPDSYLFGRKIDLAVLGRVPGALRWRPDIGHAEVKGRKHPDGRAIVNQHIAMIASVHALDGSISGVHRHYLDARKWDPATRSGVTKLTAVGGVAIKVNKASFGQSLGGHIPLWKGAQRGPLHSIAPGTDVYLSEGIEDGLSVAVSMPSARIIAGVSLSKLASVELPEQMGRLFLIGQRDPAGSAAEEALEAAIQAHQAKGRTVMLMMPPPGFKDFNDVLTDKRMDRQA